MWIVRDCAEFNNTDILHVSFIELSLSIIRGECRRISFYWLVLTLVERRKYFKVKLKTTWIVQRFAGRRRWPIPLFAFLGLRNAKPSPMIFWRLPPSLTPESVGINVSTLLQSSHVTPKRKARSLFWRKPSSHALARNVRIVWGELVWLPKCSKIR